MLTEPINSGARVRDGAPLEGLGSIVLAHKRSCFGGVRDLLAAET